MVALLAGITLEGTHQLNPAQVDRNFPGVSEGTLNLGDKIGTSLKDRPEVTLVGIVDCGFDFPALFIR